MTNDQAGQMALAMLRETPAAQTEIRRAICATLERCFGEHAEQILWRAAGSLERAMGEAAASGFGEQNVEPEVREKNGLKWESELEHAHSCRRL